MWKCLTGEWVALLPQVLQVQEDMVARVSGLRDARLHSIVEFENAYGVVLDLEQ